MITLDAALFYNFIAAGAILLAGLVLYYKWSFTYWKTIGLEYLEPTIPFGNTSGLFLLKHSFATQFAELYKQIKNRGLRHAGAFILARPVYIPTDPDLVKDITVKNFNHFVDRGFYTNEEVDPLTGNLIFLEGDKWRNLRAKITATFTSGKMKMMFDTMADCAKGMEVLINQASETQEDLDIKDILARFTTDMISSCAFGIESNSLENPDAGMRRYGKRFFECTTWENLKNVFQFVFPRSVLSVLKFTTVNSEVSSFMINVIKQTVDYREKNNIYRKDFLHLLLQLKNRGEIADDQSILDTSGKKKEVALTINQLAAQAFVFFIAGFETSSTTMTWALYELALNQDCQDKVREEIKTVLKNHDNKLTYEGIMQMTYMDQVINETLRMHPPLGFLFRRCTKPYKVPNTNINIEKGTMVVISVLGLHLDPEYYPNPEKFDPERFNEMNKKNIPPFTHLPFGEGPRVCIGLRFGMLQTKIGLTTFLRQHKATLSSKTVQPMAIDPKSAIHTTKSAIYFNISKHKDGNV